MEQYINKAAVVAEIERARQACSKVACNPKNEECSDYYLGKAQAYQEMQDFLETLEVKEVAEHDYSDLNRELEEMGIDPNSRYAKMFKEAIYNADDVLRRRKNARRAAIKSHIDKLWVAGDIIHLKDADQEKAEAFILSLAEYGYDTNKLLNEYKKTGKVTI